MRTHLDGRGRTDAEACDKLFWLRLRNASCGGSWRQPTTNLAWSTLYCTCEGGSSAAPQLAEERRLCQSLAQPHQRQPHLRCIQLLTTTKVLNWLSTLSFSFRVRNHTDSQRYRGGEGGDLSAITDYLQTHEKSS